MESLVRFTARYFSALEEELDRRGRSHFPFHSQATLSVAILRASDGFVSFYFPVLPILAVDTATQPVRHLTSGVHFLDYSAHTLNDLCGALNLNALKVLSPRLGEPALPVADLPPDGPDIASINTVWLDEPLMFALIEHRVGRIHGVAVGPTVRVVGGVRADVVPSRKVLWSPTYDLPRVGVGRAFLWTRADFWWAPERLALDHVSPAKIAEQDVLALAALVDTKGLIPAPKSPAELLAAAGGAAANAADVLDSMADELQGLVETLGGDEAQLQQWFNDPRHYLFLDPHAVEVRDRIAIGRHVPDFMVRRSDGTYAAVELEAASKRIFRKSDSEPSAEFNHACQQVADWQRYIRENVRTVRDELKLPDIYEPQGVVIMGRTQDIDTDEAKARWRHIKGKPDPTVYTYDEIIERGRALAERVRHTLDSGRS